MADVTNSTLEAIGNISPLLAERINLIITLVSAASIVLIIYIFYTIFRSILRWRDRKRIKRLELQVLRDSEQLDSIEEKVDSINSKLDLIMHAHSGKRSVKKIKNKKKKNNKNKK